MTRRDFLRLAGATMLSANAPDFSHAREASTIAVSEGKDYSQTTRNVLSALGGMKRFVRDGDVVVVKPNIGWDRRPEQAANTHPLVVKAVVEECLSAGAKKVKVFDRTCNDPRRCYVNSGIETALKGMKGVEFKHIENERFKKVQVNGVFLKDWELYDEALSANVYINVPIAKNHALTRLTLGIKNIMGIMGGNRGFIHREIEQSLADINKVFKTHLKIIDATRILTDNGPQGGSLKDVKVLNKVIASTDIVAADAYATTLFDMKPAELTTTVIAHKRGLGEMDLSKIKIIKA